MIIVVLLHHIVINAKFPVLITYTADVVDVIEEVNLPNLCLQNAAYKLEDLNRSASTTDTLQHRGHKSDIPKANRKGEVDKEKGKPAANSKSGSRQETVILHYRTYNNKTPQRQISYFIYISPYELRGELLQDNSLIKYQWSLGRQGYI